jgi:hypothetical protein
MRELAPKILLKALPRPRKTSSPRQRLSARPARQGNPEADAPFARPTLGLLLAVSDLQVLAGHVSVLLDDPALKDSGISSWLDDLDSVLDRIRREITAGRIVSREDITIDDDGPSDLHEILARCPSAEDADWPETGESRLLVRLTDWWLEQIGERGNALLHLLIGADDAVEAARSLAALDSIRYPFV